MSQSAKTLPPACHECAARNPSQYTVPFEFPRFDITQVDEQLIYRCSCAWATWPGQLPTVCHSGARAYPNMRQP